MSEYLSGRRHAAGCTLVAACEQDQGCPNRVAVDDDAAFDPSPITVLCTPDAPCPSGARLREPMAEGKWFVRVPVLHAISVAPEAWDAYSIALYRNGRWLVDCDSI